MRLDKRTLEALVALQGSREFMLFCEQLSHELTVTDRALRSASPDTYQQLQGKAQVYAEILQTVTSAREDLDKLKQNH